MGDLTEAEDYFEEKYKNDPEFQEAWDEIELEYEIARQIIKRRKELGMTQKELAEKIGTTQSVISRIENGHNISLDYLMKISEQLKCRPKIELQPIKEGK